MRSFIGLDLPSTIKIGIDQWREKELPKFVKPVSPANFHITLAFLGNIEPRDQEGIESKLEDFTHKRCSITLNSLGFWAKPKILFLGSTQPHKGLTELARSVTSRCRQAGVPVEQRDYVPHVTIVRGVKNNPPCALIKPEFEISFDRFHLFESVSTKGGIQYQIRRTWTL